MTSRRESMLFAVVTAVSLASLVSGCSCATPAAPSDAAPDAIGSDAGDDGGSDAGPPAPAPIAGELRFAGLTPAASAVTVRLSGVRVLSPRDAPRGIADAGAPTAIDAGTPDDEVVVARVEATADPHVLRFETDALPSDRVHRIGVEVDDPSGTPLEWRGPEGGLVTAGRTDVQLDAIALRTQLEVLASRPDGDRWVSRDFLSSAALTRTFRVRTGIEGALAVRVQLSTERFVVDELSATDFCEVPALAASMEVMREVSPAAGEVRVDIDLAPLFEASAARPGALGAARHRQLLAGAPIYARAVVFADGADACDPVEHGASSWVLLSPALSSAIDAIAGAPALRVTGSYEAGYYPVPEIVWGNYSCYSTIHEHQLPSSPFAFDPLGLALAMGTGSWGAWVHPGDWFCFAPPSSSSSWLEDLADAFGDFVGAVVDAVEWAVNRAASLYNQIREAAVQLVAHAITALGIECNETCVSALRAGAEIGLAAMGLPPSLPDFDALAEEGIDYLAAEVAAQVGVPPEVVERAYDIAAESVARARETRGIPYSPWAVLDTQYRATVLRLDVSRGASLSTPHPVLLAYPVSPSNAWRQHAVDVHLPAGATGALRIPVVMPAEHDGLPPVPPVVDFGPPWGPYYGGPQRVEAWFQTRAGERVASDDCARVAFWGSTWEAAASITVLVAHERVADASWHNWQENAFSDPFETQCTP